MRKWSLGTKMKRDHHTGNVVFQAMDPVSAVGWYWKNNNQNIRPKIYVVGYNPNFRRQAPKSFWQNDGRILMGTLIYYTIAIE